MLFLVVQNARFNVLEHMVSCSSDFLGISFCNDIYSSSSYQIAGKLAFVLEDSERFMLFVILAMMYCSHILVCQVCKVDAEGAFHDWTGTSFLCH